MNERLAVIPPSRRSRHLHAPPIHALLCVLSASLSVVSAVGCSRSERTNSSSTSAPVVSASTTPIVSATASPSSSTSSTPDASIARINEPPAIPLPIEPSFGEARRGTLLDLGYLPFAQGVADLLKKRFGDDLATLAAQSVALDGEHRGLFVYRPGSGLMPILINLESDGTVAWTREHALGGIHAGVEEVALATGAQGEMIIAFHDPVARVVGARRWAADGTRIMDLVMLEDVDCDALSLVRWPDRGWLVVSSSRGAIRAQLIDLNGRAPWGNSGRSVTRGWVGPAPVNVVLDTDDSAILVFHGFTPGTAGVDLTDSAVLAQRIDATGTLRYPSPVVVGRIVPTATPRGAPRVITSRTAPGRVEVSLVRGATTEVVDVTSAGAVVLR